MLFNELDVFKQIVKNKQSYFYEGPIYHKKRLQEKKKDDETQSQAGTLAYLTYF